MAKQRRQRWWPRQAPAAQCATAHPGLACTPEQRLPGAAGGALRAARGLHAETILLLLLLLLAGASACACSIVARKTLSGACYGSGGDTPDPGVA